MTSEAEFQNMVIDLMHLYGWHVNHTRRSIGKHGRWVTATSCRGFPDLTAWNPRQLRFLFAELKSEKGRVTPDQHDVLASMAETRHRGLRLASVQLRRHPSRPQRATTHG